MLTRRGRRLNRATRPPSTHRGRLVCADSQAQTYVRARTDRSWLRCVAQPLRLGQRLELLERVVLDLANALAGHVEGAADLLQRPRASAGEAEAHLDDLALALRQGRQGAVDVLLAQVLGGDLEGRLSGLVLDEVAELGLLLLADRLLERDRLLAHAQDVAHLARGALELAGDLLGDR